MLIGYARVSTARQGESLDTRRDALFDVGCDPTHFFSDTVSGSKWERPGLKKAFSSMRAPAGPEGCTPGLLVMPGSFPVSQRMHLSRPTR